MDAGFGCVCKEISASARQDRNSERRDKRELRSKRVREGETSKSRGRGRGRERERERVRGRGEAERKMRCKLSQIRNRQSGGSHRVREERSRRTFSRSIHTVRRATDNERKEREKRALRGEIRSVDG